MRIANILLTSQKGGVAQVFIDHLTILKKIGHDVCAIVAHDANYIDQIRELGIEVKTVKNCFGYHDILAVKSLKKHLEDFATDITISHMGRAMVLTRKAIKRVKNKMIFEVCVNHSMNVKRSIGANMILSVNREIFYRTVDRGQNPETTFVIPNAVEIGNSKPEEVRINLENKSEITLGVMGLIDENKGFHHAITALKNLTNSSKKFTLKIAGDGPYKENLVKLAQNLGVENQVEFLGWIGDKKKFFKEIDIFLMTSKEETFGLVTLEAIKHHKPIIATNTNGSMEIIRDEIDGILIDVNSQENLPNNLSTAIQKIISNDKKAEEMAVSAFERMKEKFSYEALEKVLKELFK